MTSSKSGSLLFETIDLSGSKSMYSVTCESDGAVGQ